VSTEGAPIQLGDVLVRFTGRAEGDLGHAGAWVEVDEVLPEVASRRRTVLDRPWSWVRQVHGDTVVRVDTPGGGAGQVGDALVAAERGPALAILTADCAPIALAADNGLYGAVHAGWRGLLAGVIDRAVDELRTLGARDIQAALGPCIHPECYEFSAADLHTVAERLGDGVRSRTAAGTPALDIPAAVRSALEQAAVALVHDVGVCTACSADHYSYRARGEAARQAMVVFSP
jgi:YfiH family protein